MVWQHVYAEMGPGDHNDFHLWGDPPIVFTSEVIRENTLANHLLPYAVMHLCMDSFIMIWLRTHALNLKHVFS